MSTIVLPTFLTSDIMDAPSLDRSVVVQADSDEIVCTAYGDCDLDACGGYTPCTCYSHCNDCTDCSDTCTQYGTGGGATLTLTGGQGTLTWRISGLSQNFTTGNGYVRAGITEDQFTVGGVDSISGIVDYRNAGSSGGTSVSGTLDYPPGTYEFWGFTETQLGGYWPAGHDTVTVDDVEVQEFTWQYAGRNPSTGGLVRGEQKVAGLGYYVSASEWNDLIDAVNGRLGTDLSYVGSGSQISAAVVNRVARELALPTVSSGDPMSADFFNELMEAVNSYNY